MMKQQDYEQIREWLYAYPEWEMIFKEYFLTHHTFVYANLKMDPGYN